MTCAGESPCKDSVVVLVLGVVLVAGCGEASGPLSQRERCTEAADSTPAEVEITRSEVAETPLLTAERRHRVGSALGEDSIQFGRISDVTSTRRSVIYAADILAHRVLVLDTLGEVRRRIGSEGNGPGEFRGLLFLHVDTADTLRAYDARLGRVSVFGPDGSVVRTYEPDPSPNHGQIPEYGFDDRGRLYQLAYDRFLSSLMDALNGRSEVTVRGEVALRRWDRTAGEWLELRSVPSQEVHFTGSGLRDAPFGRRPLWSVRPAGGVWYGDSGSYMLRKIDASGKEVCRLEVDWPEKPLTRSLADRYRSGDDVSTDDTDRIRQIRASRREMPLPESLPVLSRIVVGREGRVWVLPRGGDLRPERSSDRVWHVFSPTGVPAFRVRLPGRFRALEMASDRLLGVETDSLGVERLAVYHLPDRHPPSP